jgi:hypothetical protein
LPDPKDWHKYTKVGAKRCALKDFCGTDTDEQCVDADRIKYYNSWNGFSLLCVDHDDPNFNDFKLQGDPGTMMSEKIIV